MLMSIVPAILLDTIETGTHPGAVLRRYLNKLHFTQQAAADLVAMSRNNLSEILNERRGVTPETALALATLCHTDAEYWLTLQQRYDLHIAERRRLRRGPR